MAAHEDREHARFAPSAAYRWAGYPGDPGCPGSIALGAQLPAGITLSSEAAKEGTKAHELLESCLQAWCSPRAMATASAYDREMLDAVTIAYDYVEAKKKEYPNAIFLFETRVYITAECHGTFDCMIFDPESKQLFIVDFKYGKQSVHAAKNPQLMTYALGVLALLGVKDAQIWLVIIQPRRYDGLEAVCEAPLEERDLVAWYEQLTRAMDEADSLEPPFRPEPGRCKYCPSATLCVAVAPQMVDIPVAIAPPTPKGKRKGAQPGAAPFPPGTILQRGEPVPPRSVSESTLQKVAEALDGLPALKAYISSVESLAHTLAVEHNLPLPGYKVVFNKPRLEWAATTDEVIGFFEKLSIPPYEVTQIKPVAITTAKKLLLAHISQHVRDHEEVLDLTSSFAKLCDRPASSKKELVPASDPRQAAGVDDLLAANSLQATPDAFLPLER